MLGNLGSMFQTHEMCTEWNSQIQQQNKLRNLVMQFPELIKTKCTVSDSQTQQQGKLGSFMTQFSEPIKILQYGIRRYTSKVSWENL
jgi:hypothetical protein